MKDSGLNAVLVAAAFAALLVVAGCESAPTSFTYECPITSSGDSTVAVGDTVTLDCTRTAP